MVVFVFSVFLAITSGYLFAEAKDNEILNPPGYTIAEQKTSEDEVNVNQTENTAIEEVIANVGNESIVQEQNSTLITKARKIIASGLKRSYKGIFIPSPGY